MGNAQFTLSFLFRASRPVKRFISIIADTLFISLSFWAAIIVRLDTLTVFHDKSLWLLLALLIPISLFINIRLGLYRAVIRYINSKAAINIAISVILSTLAFILLSFYLNITIARTVPIIYAAFLMILVAGSRFIVIVALSSSRNKNKENVIIYGAGSSGRQLAQSLLHGNEYVPVAFIDDDKQIQKNIIHGIMVYSRYDISKLISKFGVRRILLAMPKENKKRISNVLNKLEPLSYLFQDLLI